MRVQQKNLMTCFISALLCLMLAWRCCRAIITSAEAMAIEISGGAFGLYGSKLELSEIPIGEGEATGREMQLEGVQDQYKNILSRCIEHSDRAGNKIIEAIEEREWLSVQMLG